MPFFYKKNQTSSVDQLSKDFGDFPPRPLSSRLNNNKFDIISLSGLAGRYYTISRIYRSFKRDPEKESDSIQKELIQEMRNNVSVLKDSFSELKIAFFSLPLVKRGFVLLVVLAASPLLLFFIVFLLLKLTYSLSRIKEIGTESLGFYSPRTQDRSEIVIKPASIKKSQIQPEAIVSHEHLHLLQDACFSTENSRKIESDFSLNINKYLNDDNFNSKYVLYYLSLNEVEARLHEIVLSYYRKHKLLPVDYHGFLSLILACDLLGEHVRRLLSEFDVPLSVEGRDEYALRENAPGEDILFMLSYFSDSRYAKRFVCEALSVMYGNLLILYGDSEKAIDYFRTVESQDFYYEIYGEHASPVMRAGTQYELKK